MISLSPLHLGVLLVVFGFSLASVADGISKLLIGSLPVVIIVWGRLVTNLLILAPPAFAKHGVKIIRPNRPWLQLLRGILLVLATVSMVKALEGLPLADALAIAFAYPFVVTALSPLILGERVYPAHWLAVAIGFAGVLVVMRPGFQSVGIHALLALATGIMFALTLLITRLLSRTDPPMVTIMFSIIVGLVVLTPPVILVWEPPTWTQWGLLAMIGLCSCGSHLSINQAYSIAPAATLAPIGYSEIVAGTAVGYLMFGDFPDLVTWIGIAIITASGIFIATTKSTAGSGRTGTTV